MTKSKHKEVKRWTRIKTNKVGTRIFRTSDQDYHELPIHLKFTGLKELQRLLKQIRRYTLSLPKGVSKKKKI